MKVNQAIKTSLLWVILLIIGCSGPNHEGSIRQRFQQVVGHLCRSDVEACMPLVDPLFVRGSYRGRMGETCAGFRQSQRAGDRRLG